MLKNSVKLENINPTPSSVINIQYDPFDHQMSGMMSWLTR